MRTSDPWNRLGTAVLVFGAGGFLAADELKMADDARLTGTVRSITEAGVVELSSPLSNEPVWLKAGSVGKVEFSPGGSPSPVPGTLLELANGDLLPVDIDFFDGTNLGVTTADSGKLTIPRSALKSMQLGVRSSRVIYSGPNDPQEWKRDDSGSGAWTFNHKSLVANGPAQIARDFETPRQFVLKFTLKWQAAASYQIFFADPLKPKAEAMDRYYMQFNPSGLEIKRESATGKRYHTVILLARTPEQFPNRQLDVEIRVDRKNSRIHLLLNGEVEGEGIDPVPTAPVGTGVRLGNTSGAGGNPEIRGIQILELDNTRSRHRAEDRGDTRKDSLISREDDRWGGHLSSIRKGDEGMLFEFRSDFQDEPLEIPQDDVSTIFFARPDPEPPADGASPFVLRLNGEGSLRVTSCVFSEKSVLATHPLLGTLEIPRSGVTAMERVDVNPEPAGNK